MPWKKAEVGVGAGEMTPCGAGVGPLQSSGCVCVSSAEGSLSDLFGEEGGELRAEV